MCQSYNDFEVIIVDNGSTDGSVKWLQRQYPLVRLITFQENKGFAAACNAGVNASWAEYIVFLNNDTEPYTNWLGSLAGVMDTASAHTACLASKMLQLERPGLIDDAGDILTWRGGAFKRGHGERADIYCRQEEVMLPCAGAAMYRRVVLENVGSFDETFVSYLEDIDLGLRIRLAGYTCIFVPQAVVLHLGHGSLLPHDQYVFLTARNRIFLFWKNIPALLLFKHFSAFIYGWLFFYLAHNFSKMHIKGTLASFKYFPEMMRKHRAIRLNTKLSLRAIDNTLSRQWPEISLWQLSSQWLRHFIGRKE